MRNLLYLTLTLPFLAGCGQEQPRVVLYCAQDREFAEGILKDFTTRTGIQVASRFDSEANKAVGLFADLVDEKDRPRCDVHWNNEILATIRLARLGLLEPYDSPAAQAFSAVYRDPGHRWTAFGARARVLLLNTKRLEALGIPKEEWPRSLRDLLDPRLQGQVAMAKPMAGTTATEAACLFQVWGKDEARAFYRGLRERGAQILPGNKPVAEAVGQGTVAVGMTDTDDAMAEVEGLRPVRIVFPDADAPADSRRGTLFLPNTVAVIRGGPDMPGARQLVDFLLSPEVERKLAESASHQLPLNPQVKATLPAAMAAAQTASRLPVNFEQAADMWEESQAFLRELYGRP